jgi:hypothetical protein
MTDYYVNTGAAAGGDGTTAGLTGTHRACNSLADWQALYVGTPSAQLDIHCVGTAAHTSRFILNGSWVLTSTNRLVFHGEGGNYQYDTSKFRIEFTSAGGYESGFTGGDNVDVLDMQVKITNTGFSGISAIENLGAGLTNKVLRCIVVGVCSGTSATTGILFGGICRACLAYDFLGGSNQDTGFNGSDIGSFIDNCGAYHCDVGLANVNYQATRARNCWAQACTDGFGSSPPFQPTGTDHNCSDIGSDAPGSNAVTGTVSFSNTGTKDFRLASGDTVAKNAGANLSGDFNYTLTGASWGGTFSIGPLPAVAGAAVSGLLSQANSIAGF